MRSPAVPPPAAAVPEAADAHEARAAERLPATPGPAPGDAGAPAQSTPTPTPAPAGAWLSDALLQAFGRQAHAEPFAAEAAVPLLGWDTLDRLLADRPDLLVADRGAEVGVPAPRSGAEARRCLDGGHSIVIRRVERHDAALAALARAFARQFAATVHIQVFVTPAGRQTFGWHYDDEHVFVLQTLGAKQYWFSRNTVVERLDRPDFAAFARETSPLMGATLRAGDLLYLPRGFWHKARAEEESMHLSVGVRPAAGGNGGDGANCGRHEG